jgi:hypothetical protein
MMWQGSAPRGVEQAVSSVNAPQGLCRDSGNPSYPWDHILGSDSACHTKACACSQLLRPDVPAPHSERS